MQWVMQNKLTTLLIKLLCDKLITNHHHHTFHRQHLILSIQNPLIKLRVCSATVIHLFLEQILNIGQAQLWV